MKHSNLLQFPSEQSGGNGLKGFAAIFHLYLAYMMTFHYHLSGEGLGLLMLLALLYAVFVRKKTYGLSGLRGNGPLIVVVALGGFFLVLGLLSGRMGTIVLMASVVLISGFYWLTVGRNGKEAPYFVRFHLLTALVLNLFLLLGYMLLGALLQFLMTVAHALRLDVLLGAAGTVVPGLWMLMFVIFWAVALYLVVNVLLGRTPYIALVTSNVRHWV